MSICGCRRPFETKTSLQCVRGTMDQILFVIRSPVNGIRKESERTSLQDGPTACVRIHTVCVCVYVRSCLLKLKSYTGKKNNAPLRARGRCCYCRILFTRKKTFEGERTHAHTNTICVHTRNANTNSGEFLLLRACDRPSVGAAAGIAVQGLFFTSEHM